MVNFGLLTAEIRWRVWGTSANFNEFRVLAALLHGTLVVGVSQTLRAHCLKVAEDVVVKVHVRYLIC